MSAKAGALVYSMLLGILRSWKVTPSLLAAFAAALSSLCLHIPITSSWSLCSHFSFHLATCLFRYNLSSAVTAFGWPVSAMVPGEGIMPHSSTEAQQVVRSTLPYSSAPAALTVLSPFPTAEIETEPASRESQQLLYQQFL